MASKYQNGYRVIINIDIAYGIKHHRIALAHSSIVYFARAPLFRLLRRAHSYRKHRARCGTLALNTARCITRIGSRSHLDDLRASL